MTTKIVCKALDCIFNESRTCISEEIVYDPEEGCLTYEVLDDLVELEGDDDDWDDDELFDDDDDGDIGWEDADEDLLVDDDLEDEL